MVKYSLFRQDGSQVGDYDLEQLKDYESENYYVMDGDDRVLVGNFLKREQSKSFDPDKTTFFNKLKLKKPIPKRELELDSEENLKELENLFESNEELNENQNEEEKIEKRARDQPVYQKKSVQSSLATRERERRREQERKEEKTNFQIELSITQIGLDHLANE